MSTIQPSDLDLRAAELPGDPATLPATLALLLLVGACQRAAAWGWVAVGDVQAFVSASKDDPGFAWVTLAGLGVPPNFRELVACGLAETDGDPESGTACMRLTANALEQLAASRWRRKEPWQA